MATMNDIYGDGSNHLSCEKCRNCLECGDCDCTKEEEKKMTKKLFILISDGGDGSSYPQFTMNEEWIKKMEEKDANGELCYPDIGCDGDGFHYKTLTVPDECTLESLGIRYDIADKDEDDED